MLSRRGVAATQQRAVLSRFDSASTQQPQPLSRQKCGEADTCRSGASTALAGIVTPPLAARAHSSAPVELAPSGVESVRPMRPSSYGSGSVT